MSNIEEDIKTMHKIISFYKDLDIINDNGKCKEIKAIEHILAEREQDKNRIKELEAKLEFKQWGDLDNTQFEEYMSQFVSKQKIKDNYLKMEKEYARKVYDDNYNRIEVKKEESYKRQVYEELLKEK